MNPTRYRLSLLIGTLGFAVAGGASLSAATVEPIIVPAKRTEVLERAKSVLAAKEMPSKVANPFYTESFTEALHGGPRPGDQAPQSPGTPETPSTPRAPRGLLESIAASLKPSGFFVIGGQPTLVFGQKRVKAGGILTITFEGKEYNLEVTALDRTHFTLRLDREEFTRPIK